MLFQCIKIMNQGKYVFSQVIEFIPRYQFDKLVRQYKGDWHIKSLNSYNHLLHLLSGRIIEDARIRVTGYKSSKLYPEDVRFVRIYDPENDSIVDFISNNFDVSALEIANLYRHRWDIEVFFKWIKQSIVVKNLWGYSENAVKVHLWSAIISYLTVARIKADYKSPYSITKVATLIRISALERTELRALLTRQDPAIISNQNVKELSLFDDV